MLIVDYELTLCIWTSLKHSIRYNHRRLLMKLKAHGIDGVVLERIRRWLTDRKQRVNLNGGTSDWLLVLSGLQHDSVLGPCLFLIYI